MVEHSSGTDPESPSEILDFRWDQLSVLLLSLESGCTGFFDLRRLLDLLEPSPYVRGQLLRPVECETRTRYSESFLGSTSHGSEDWICLVLYYLLTTKFRNED